MNNNKKIKNKIFHILKQNKTCWQFPRIGISRDFYFCIVSHCIVVLCFTYSADGLSGVGNVVLSQHCSE